MSEPTIPLRPVPGAKFVSPQGTRAIKDGVKKVFIINGEVPHALLIELLTNEGLGTMFVE